MLFNEKKIAVVGLGVAGGPAARWLAGQGAAIVPVDDQRDGQDFLGMEIMSGNRSLPLLEAGEVDLVVSSPGISPDHVFINQAISMDVPVVGELYLAASLWQGPLIGITGTNGKTTTTLLTGHLLRKAGVECVMAGNIGTSLFDFMEDGHEDVCAVLEISSFQLEYFPQRVVEGIRPPRFRAAVCLNVAPDHLDRHGGMDGYRAMKLRLFSFQAQGDIAVLGRGMESFVTEVPANAVVLSNIVDSVVGDRLVMEMGNETLDFDLSKWSKRCPGRHNLDNLVAAFVCASTISDALHDLEGAVEDFRPPEHRLEQVCEIDGVRFIDDSKSTNVHALDAALSSLSGDIILIAGGRGKGEDFEALAESIAKANGRYARIKMGIFIGEEAWNMCKSLEPVLERVHVIEGVDGKSVMEEAVAVAFRNASRGDSIVLSPACASFDLFDDYVDRGRAFRSAVMGLGAER